MQKNLIPVTGLALVVIIVLAVNLVGALLFSRVKMDLTEEKLFTLSKGSHNILNSLEEPITAKFYYSKTAAAKMTRIKAYADRVTDLLREYEASSNGKLKLEIIDPRPDTEDAETAERSGLQPVAGGFFGGGGEPLFLGLVMRDEDGNGMQIPSFNPSKESTLEYDISKAIYSIRHQEKKKVGVLSALPVMGGGPPPNPMMGMNQPPPSPPWIFTQELRNYVQLEQIETTAKAIPKDIDVLLIVHPQNFSDELQYAIDQYVLGGGRAIVFVDAFSYTQKQSMPEGNWQMMMQMPMSSNLPKLLEAWGVEMIGGAPEGGGMPPMGGGGPEAKVIADQSLGLSPGQGATVKFLSILELQGENCGQEAIVTQELENVWYVSGGGLKKTTESDDIEFTELLFTSDAGKALDSMNLKFARGLQPGILEQSYKDQDTSAKIVLAYQIAGKFKTAFPEGKPKASGAEKKDDEPADEANHLAESKVAATVIVVADADMLYDQFCVRMVGQGMALPMNNNVSFVANAIEFLSGSQDLIGLRSRGSSQQPFKKVKDIEAAAQAKWQKREEQLDEELKDANDRLRKLQQGNKDKRELNQELMAEVNKWRKTRTETSKELSKVKRSLREDVEKLGFRIKFINIALIPVIVMLLGIGIAVLRSLAVKSTS